MTPQQLAICTGARIDRATEHLEPLLAAMEQYCIDTPQRQAAFLAQIGHESGGLHWLVELWGPTESQMRYEGRASLGNTTPGDGYKFRGRGLIQTTGRANYKATGIALNLPLLDEPELLGQSPHADRSAAWFFSSHGCNELADVGNFEKITKVINGGLNGYPERLGLWAKAKEALGC